MKTRWAVLSLVVALVSCSDANRTAEAFCAELRQVTGPSGVEVVVPAGDPARLDGLVVELGELHDRAPDDISTTTAALLDFFDRYQRSGRDERRDLLSSSEQAMIQASSELDDYALNTCGLFLQRSVPTPIPTVDPGIEIAPE